MDRSSYRIIDANFNRAREACRVIEDLCRFALNSGPLSARAKQLRHELCAIIGKLDSAKLLSARDTISDVGVGRQVPGQLPRTCVDDSLTAACKRLPEALRVITETLKPDEPQLADAVERLRYEFYTLEKDIMLSSANAKFAKTRLYIVITSDDPLEIINLTNRCIAGGADCIQLRSKNLPAGKLFTTAVQMCRLCQAANVLCVINDRADIAVAAGADGVHLGQDDLPNEQARKLALSPLLTGKSTHSIDQLKAAVEELPTYVSLGPVFPTGTKPDAPAVGLEYVTAGTKFLADKGIAHVAIGGITVENVADVIKAGARTVAVCSAVTQAADPAAACRALKAKIEAFLP
ncbi:MAG: thiamine phosphate synthase [Phycisphaerae bacterium]|jgi:thiamine-phosphate pyrophosphorylase